MPQQRHRCAGGLKKLHLRSGSERHRHFIGFFKMPVLHRHRATLFIRLFRETAHLVAFYDTLEIRRKYSHLKPPASSWGRRSAIVVQSKFLVAFLCCLLVFEFSVGVGGFVIGLS